MNQPHKSVVTTAIVIPIVLLAIVLLGGMVGKTEHFGQYMSSGLLFVAVASPIIASTLAVSIYTAFYLKKRGDWNIHTGALTSIICLLIVLLIRLIAGHVGSGPAS